MKEFDIRKILKHDSIILLIVSIVIPAIVMMLLGNNFSEGDVPFVMKSLVYIIWLIYLLTRKKADKYIGVTAIYIGMMMLLGNIFGSSIFELIFVLLSIMYIVHGIMYVIKVKRKDNKLHILLIIMYFIQAFVFYLLFFINN